VTRALIGLVLLGLALPAARPVLAQNTNDPREAKTTGKSDWEIQEEQRNFNDGEVALPATPRAENLIEFFPSSASSFRFFVDAASLSVGDGLVRYTLVARSSSGYENVSYEGMRCSANMIRVYARLNGSAWSREPGSDWKPIPPKTVQRWHNDLRDRYFCPIHAGILTRAEGLDALRRGGHPCASGTGNSERY